jgi:hypothetical protein
MLDNRFRILHFPALSGVGTAPRLLNCQHHRPGMQNLASLCHGTRGDGFQGGEHFGFIAASFHVSAGWQCLAPMVACSFRSLSRDFCGHPCFHISCLFWRLPTLLHFYGYVCPCVLHVSPLSEHTSLTHFACRSLLELSSMFLLVRDSTGNACIFRSAARWQCSYASDGLGQMYCCIAPHWAIHDRDR